MVRRALSRNALCRLSGIEDNRRRYDASLEVYAGDALIIRPKASGAQLLRFNEVQRTLDTELDNQLNEKARVRALVLKARQVGISTYCTARHYRGTTRRTGVRSLMMAHRDDATTNIFGMVKRSPSAIRTRPG